jgi:hypothetical protein
VARIKIKVATSGGGKGRFRKETGSHRLRVTKVAVLGAQDEIDRYVWGMGKWLRERTHPLVKQRCYCIAVYSVLSAEAGLIKGILYVMCLIASDSTIVNRKYLGGNGCGLSQDLYLDTKEIHFKHVVVDGFRFEYGTRCHWAGIA